MISTAELANKTFTGLDLPDPYGDFLGEIPENASMSIWGPPGSGKSTFAIAIALILADLVGKGIYCSSEEGPGPSMQSKIKRMKAEHDNILVSDYDGMERLKSAVEFSSSHFVIVDSISKSAISVADFEQFLDWCKDRDVISVFILHTTKEGNYKGHTEFIHDPDIEIKVEDGLARTENKNRFQETPREMEVEFERGRREKQEVKRENPFTPDDNKENIRRGITAMQKVIENHKDIDEAMKHSELGWIDFVWGKEGNPKKEYQGGYGISHIIAKRDHEAATDNAFKNQQGKDVAIRLPIVIGKGQLGAPYQEATKINITYAGYQVVLSRDWKGKGRDWVLTGYRISKKRKNPDETGEVQQFIQSYTPETYINMRSQTGAGLDLPQNTKNVDKRENPDIPSVSENAFGGFNSLKELKKQVLKWAKSNIAGKEIINKEQELPISINWQGLKKASGSYFSKNKLLSIKELPALLTSASLKTIENDFKKRDEVKAIYKFTSPIYINNCLFEANLVVREVLQGRFYYDHNLSQIKKPDGNSGNPPQRENMHQPTSGLPKDTKNSKNRKNPDNVGELRTLIRHYASEGYLDNRPKMGAGFDQSQNTKNVDKRENPETTPKAVEGGCQVTVQAETNARKHGIEIRFSGEPSDGIKDQLKSAGFLYFTPKGEPSFWSAKISAETKRVAESIAGRFDTAVLDLRKKGAKSEKQEERSEKQEDRSGKQEAKSLAAEDSLKEDKKQAGNKKEASKTANSFGGRKTTVDFKADGSIQETARFAVMEASKVIPSHNKDCSRNSAHTISKGQPRDRSLDALCSQPKFIAQNLNPNSITQGNLAFNGAPSVLPDGQVIQGNGRSIALKIAYDEHPEQASNYRSYLIDHAGHWGFKAKEIESYRQPVLVRVIDVSDARAVELGNVVDTSQAKMSKIDRGKAYIRNLPKEKKQIIGNLIDDSSGETLGQVIDETGRTIFNQFKDLDRQGLVESNKLTSDGKDFLKSVFAGLVFDSDENPQALQHFLNLNHRQQSGLKRSYGNIIPFIGTAADLTGTIQQAVEIVDQVQGSEGINTAGDYLAQSDAFSGSNSEKFSKQAAQLAKFLLDAGTQKFIRNGFRMYQYKINGKDDLFDPIEKVDPRQAFTDAFVERMRMNPEEPLVYAFHTERLIIDDGDTRKQLEGNFPSFLSGDKLYIVPSYRVEKVKNAVESEEAADDFEEFSNYPADEVDYEIDWPAVRAQGVGTAEKIWYASDKVIEPGDQKGQTNFYVHDFDAGQRPAVVKGDVLIIGNIEWNQRGLLN